MRIALRNTKFMNTLACRKQLNLSWIFISIVNGKNNKFRLSIFFKIDHRSFKFSNTINYKLPLVIDQIFRPNDLHMCTSVQCTLYTLCDGSIGRNLEMVHFIFLFIGILILLLFCRSFIIIIWFRAVCISSFRQILIHRHRSSVTNHQCHPQIHLQSYKKYLSVNLFIAKK